MADASRTEVFPRQLTPREAEILDFMLGVDDPRIEPLREQRKSVVATRICGCGCASIDLAVDRGRYEPAAVCRQPIAADFNPARADLADPMEAGGLLVFLDEGWLSLLEIWWIERPPTEFPPAAAFHAPEVTCEQTEAAIAALERRSTSSALSGATGVLRRLFGRRPTSDTRER